MAAVKRRATTTTVNMRERPHTVSHAPQAELVAGVAEVLATLSRATTAHSELEKATAAEAAAATTAGSGSGSTGGGGQASGMPEHHRALLNACLQAQAWLQSLLHTHDGGDTTMAPSRDAVTLQSDTPGLAPRGSSYGMAYAAATSDATDDNDGNLTWTSATGAQDVHARLYE